MHFVLVVCEGQLLDGCVCGGTTLCVAVELENCVPGTFSRCLDS